MGTAISKVQPTLFETDSAIKNEDNNIVYPTRVTDGTGSFGGIYGHGPMK